MGFVYLQQLKPFVVFLVENGSNSPLDHRLVKLWIFWGYLLSVWNSVGLYLIGKHSITRAWVYQDPSGSVFLVTIKKKRIGGNNNWQ